VERERSKNPKYLDIGGFPDGALALVKPWLKLHTGLTQGSNGEGPKWLKRA